MKYNRDWSTLSKGTINYMTLSVCFQVLWRRANGRKHCNALRFLQVGWNHVKSQQGDHCIPPSCRQRSVMAYGGNNWNRMSQITANLGRPGAGVPGKRGMVGHGNQEVNLSSLQWPCNQPVRRYPQCDISRVQQQALLHVRYQGVILLFFGESFHIQYMFVESWKKKVLWCAIDN